MWWRSVRNAAGNSIRSVREVQYVEAARCGLRQLAAIMLDAVRIEVLVPRLLPRNTLLPRLLPREIVTGGRSLQCSAFQGWSPGTRMDCLIPGSVEYNLPADLAFGGAFFIQRPAIGRISSTLLRDSTTHQASRPSAACSPDRVRPA